MNKTITKFAYDAQTLIKVADYFDSDKLSSIGGIDELKNFIAKHPDVPCSTCNGGGLPVFGTRTMDEMIENFVEVGYLYRNKPDLWKKLKLGTESANAAMREGTQHTLKAFKDNPSKYAPDKIEGIDLRFEIGLDGIDNCSQCRYDVKLKLGNKPRMVEFKSYASTTWAGIANNPKFLRQFKEYLRNVDVKSIDDLAYIYNPNKASLNEVKTAFKEMMISKKDEIYNAMNKNLKNSLGIDTIGDVDNDLIDEMLEVIVKSN